MKRLPITGLDVMPSQNNPASQLPAAYYHDWIGLCKRHQLIPEEVVAYQESDKNCLWIPPHSFDRDTVYTTLCCYRLADSNPGPIWQIVENLKLNPETTFWQCLHYGLSQCHHHVLHSFSSIQANSTERFDFLRSLALKEYFSQPFGQRASRHSLVHHIDSIASNLGMWIGTIRKPSVSRFLPIGRSLNLKLHRVSDILWPAWSVLYNMQPFDAVEARKHLIAIL